MDTFIVKVVNNHKISADEIGKEIILAEGRMNVESKVRFHMEGDIMAKVEETFKQRCITQRVEFESPEFYETQIEFFAGAMSVLSETPPKWTTCIMSSRPIIEQYEF